MQRPCASWYSGWDWWQYVRGEIKSTTEFPLDVENEAAVTRQFLIFILILF